MDTVGDEDLKRVIERLAARLERIEGYLQLGPARELPEAPPEIPPAPPPAAPPAVPPQAPARPPAPARPAAPAKPPTVGAARVPPTMPVGPSVAAREKAPALARVAAPAKRPPKTPKASLEVRIGQNWMAWVGAILVVIAMGFLVKLAVDLGWWGRLTAVTRCVLIAGFGVLLLAGGELALRRIGVAASVGLFGAGLGTLYLDAYAAFKWFERAGASLVSQEWAYVLMAVVALLGFGITLRSRFLTIGILSLVGGYVTPVLLAGGKSHIMEVGAYLTMLLFIALGLSAARPRNFRTLRYVALGAQGLIGLWWVLGAIGTNWITALVLVTIWWGAVTTEIVWAALRRQSAFGNVFAGLLTTAWFVSVGCWILQSSQPAGTPWMGLFALAAGLMAAALAATFGPPVDELARPRAAMDKLAIALWAQAGVLLAVAVALQFKGYAESIGWLLLGLASVEIGRRLIYRSVEIFGLVVGALALGRVAILDYQLAGMSSELFAFGGVTVSKWTILALFAVAATHLTARRLRDAWRKAPVILAALGTLGWLAVCYLQCRGLWLTGGWLVASMALISADRIGRRQRYFEIGLMVLVATAGWWLLMDAVTPRLQAGWSATDSLPFLNWQMAMAAAIGAVGWWSSRVLVRRAKGVMTFGDSGAVAAVGWQVAVMAGAIVLLVAVSFEIDRVVEIMAARGRSVAWSFGQLRQLLFTLAWALGSVGVAVVARTLLGVARGEKGLPVTRGPWLLTQFAWSLLLLCAAKWLFGDTFYWAFIERTGRAAGALPVANLQMMVGIVVAASAVVLYHLLAGAPEKRPEPATGQARVAPGAWVPAAAALLLLWGLTFEVDRVIGRIEASPEWASPWPQYQLRALWWTLLWGAGGLAMMAWTRLRRSGPMLLTGWSVLILAAAAWLAVDTVAWRIQDGVVAATVVVNIQFLVGVLLAVMLGAAVFNWSRGDADPALKADDVRRMGLIFIGVIGLWLGTLEFDRLFADDPGVRQTAFSIYWGVYAIAMVALGFAGRSTACRYAGLGLLVLTLAKVLTVDFAEADRIYRVLSFLGTGLLLLATSVGYAKLAPRLLK